MDSKRLEQLITENMRSIFGFALTRLANVQLAEELASDIMYQIIKSAEKLKCEDRFYGFMWKIAENTYMDYLRKKSKPINNTVELDENTIAENESIEDQIVKKEDLNLLRRELSLLSDNYRKATVMYYIEDISCSEIAEKLKISTEMVKYYLFRARKMIREGMKMDRLFGEKSYNPSVFEIDFWGTKAGDDKEYKEFKLRKIRGNILVAAYYTPMTIQELSVELGVAVTYLEDEIKLLIDRQYLVFNNGKYLTNIPIFTFDCTNIINGKLKELTTELAKEFTDIADEFASVHGDKFENENIMRWQKLLMCLHFALIKSDDHLKEKYGELPENGPYSLINGGGGHGIIWGRCIDKTVADENNTGIQGIYNGAPSQDKRGSVIAMNFDQVTNVQSFCMNLTDPVVCTAVDCFDYLPDEWKKSLEKQGYSNNGKANFPVYTLDEYRELEGILKRCIDIITKLDFKTMEVAAKVTSDIAPIHIREYAEYVGALVYCFNSTENLVNALYEMEYIKPVYDTFKPAMCVIKNK